MLHRIVMNILHMFLEILFVPQHVLPITMLPQRLLPPPRLTGVWYDT